MRIRITTALIAWVIGLLEAVCVVIAALLPQSKADSAAIILTLRAAFEYLRMYLANNPLPKSEV